MSNEPIIKLLSGDVSHVIPIGDESMSISMVLPAGQSNRMSVSHSVSQSVGRSISQSASQFVGQSVSQSASQ